MKHSFKNYRTQRENQEFCQKFNTLCEAIAVSGVRFEDYWANVAVPTLTESYSYSNEEELLNEFWKSLFGGGKQQGRQETPVDLTNFDPNPQSDMITKMVKWQNDQKAKAEAERQAARQKKLGAFQQTVDQHIDMMKKRFSTAMRDFLKATTDDAKNQNDPHMWKIANNFYKKIMSVSQPVVDEFKMQAKFGANGYKDEFAQQRGAMAQSQMQGMKQGLQSKFAGQAPAAAAPTAAPTPAPAPANPASAMGGSQPAAQTSSGPTLGRDPKTGRITRLTPKTV
jgi:hypothetical protein